MTRILGGAIARADWTAEDLYDQRHAMSACRPSRTWSSPQVGAAVLQPGSFRTNWRSDAMYPTGGPCVLPGNLAVVDDGNLVGHKLDADTWFLWRFNEEDDGKLLTLTDATANGRDAIASTATNASIPRSFGPNNLPGASGFVYYPQNNITFVRDPNGATTDYVCASDATLVAAAKTQYTVEFFVLFDGSVGSKTIWTWGSSNNLLHRVDIVNGGWLRVFWEVATVDQDMNSATFPTILPRNRWVHCAIVKNATMVRFYQEGRFVGEVAKAAEPTFTNATIHVYNNLGVNLYTTSTIKDLKFTTRAKTDAEIDTAARLCLSTFTLPVEVDTLVMYRLNERCDTVVDSGPHKMHLYPTTNVAYPRISARAPAVIPGDAAGSSLYSSGNFWATFAQWNSPDSLGYSTTKMREMLQRSNGYTFECWYKIGDNAGELGLWCFGDPAQGAADLNFLTVDIMSDRRLRYWSEYNTDADSTVSTVNAIPIGKHHLALRINPTSAGAHSLDMFIDGAYVETIAGIIKFNFGEKVGASQAFFLGYGSTETSNMFTGFLDDVRFSGVPRTNAEILESYTRGSASSAIAPTISIISPTPSINPGLPGGFPIDPAVAAQTSIVVRVTSPGGVTLINVVARYPGDPVEHVVYRRGSFRGEFAAHGVLVPAGDNFDLTCLPVDGWPSSVALEDIVFDVDAIAGGAISAIGSSS